MLPTFDVPRGAIALGEMLEHSSSPDWRRSGLIAQTLGAVALGRLERLHDLTRRLAEVAPETELELFNAELPAALAYVDPGSIPTIGALDDLSSWIASSGVDPLRDRAVWMSTLLGRPTPARPGARGEFELFIVADSLAAAGHPRAALVLLDPIDVDGVASRVDPFFRAIVHLQRAAWRGQIGDIERARSELLWHEHLDVVGLPTGLPQAAEVDWAFGTLARWRLARLLDRTGRPQRGEACEAYAAAVRQSVREAIHMVKHYVGDKRLKTAGDVVELLDGAVELDTDQLDDLMKQRDWARATPLINGEFVAGFKIPDAAGFEDWLTVERSHWHGRAMDALLCHAEERLDAGDETGADDPIVKARRMDPRSERALRAHLRRLAATGDRSGALRTFEEFSQAAQRDGDASREPQTIALVERLRSARAWHLPKDALSPDRSISWRRAPLLGRQRDVATALSQWRLARAGRLSLLVIEAESGGGKTRFTEELATRAQLDGGIVIATRAVSADVEQPASGMVSLAHGGLVDVPGVAGANPAALATLGAHAGEWAERFPQRTAPSGWSIDAALAEVLRVTTAE